MDGEIRADEFSARTGGMRVMIPPQPLRNAGPDARNV